MKAFEKRTNEVFYARDSLVYLDQPAIEILKQTADENSSRKSRICTHLSEQDSVHEMIIVHAHDYYVRPHKHHNKSESFHVVEGEMDLLLFDQQGELTQVIEMGEYRSGKTFYYRLSSCVYHSLIIRSVQAVFHETTAGPFNPADSSFAPWAPENDQGHFVEQLSLNADDFIKRNNHE